MNNAARLSMADGMLSALEGLDAVDNRLRQLRGLARLLSAQSALAEATHGEIAATFELVAATVDDVMDATEKVRSACAHNPENSHE